MHYVGTSVGVLFHSKLNKEIIISALDVIKCIILNIPMAITEMLKTSAYFLGYIYLPLKKMRRSHKSR